MVLITCAALLSVGCVGGDASDEDVPSAYTPDEAVPADETDRARQLEEMRTSSEETRRKVEAMLDEDEASEGHVDEIEAARSEADSLHQALIDLIES